MNQWTSSNEPSRPARWIPACAGMTTSAGMTICFGMMIYNVTPAKAGVQETALTAGFRPAPE